MSLIPVAISDIKIIMETSLSKIQMLWWLVELNSSTTGLKE